MVDSSFPQQLDALPLDLQERLGDFLEQYADSVERGEPISHVSWVQEFPQLQAYIERMMLDIDALCKISSERKPHSGVAFAPSSVTQGSVLGDFEILQELGRGGMGVVYLAQQRSLQRRVALKMLPFAAILDSNQIARFHTEAQAAASLHHPNIVPVYSVGCERGVHYYSMQYIDGQTVEAFLDSLKQGTPSQHAWTDSYSTSPAAAKVESVAHGIQSTRRTSKSTPYIRQIAGKMAHVAMALNFAHSRGVIHRDIKPSNLMIDRHGNLWLTDFGLARIQDGQSVTIDGDLVGTLRYMSPEQANGQTHLVDHRADIYSFGVTLYEMLTLRYAFDGSDRYQVMAAIQRAKPALPRSINPSIPADLETIVAKCMSPDKDERYATAGDLADDLYRFLNHQPIAARRPSVADRLGKWALRKKKWVAVAAMAMLILAIGSMAFTFFIFQQRNRAEMFANNAQMIVDRFGSEFADQLEGIPGTEEVRRNILRETSEYYSQLIQYSDQDSALERHAAHAAHRLAVISQRLGKIEGAGLAYRDSLDRWKRYVNRNGLTPEDESAFAACHRDFAVLQSKLGDEHSARSHFDSALALLETTKVDSEFDPKRLVEISKIRSELSLFYAKTGNTKSAIDLLTQSVTDLEQSLSRETDDYRSERSAQIVYSLNNHASILLDQDPGQAATLLRRAATLQTDSDLDNRPSLNDRMLRAIVQSNRGIAERKLGNTSFAESQFQCAFQELSLILERYPDYVKAHIELAACYNNWAQLHLDNRDHARAKSCFEEAKTLLVAAQIRFPAQPEIPHFLNLIQHNLGILNDSNTKANPKLVSDGDSIS
jgi:serine/threonine protein kinase